MAKIFNIKGEEVDREDYPEVVQLRETTPKRDNKELLDIINCLNQFLPNGFLVFLLESRSRKKTEDILRHGMLFGRYEIVTDYCIKRIFDSQSKHPDGDFNYMFNSINASTEEGNRATIAVFERQERDTYLPVVPANFDKIEHDKKIQGSYFLGYINPKNQLFINPRFLKRYNLEEKFSPTERVLYYKQGKRPVLFDCFL